MCIFSEVQDVAVSSGSACTSASLEPSYVLRALGVEEDMAHTSIRYCLQYHGQYNGQNHGQCLLARVHPLSYRSGNLKMAW